MSDFALARPADQYVLAAKLGAVHGLRGYLKLHSFTEPFDNIVKYRPWFIDSGTAYQVMVCDQYQRQAKGLIVHFEGLNSREVTEHLCNKELYIQRKQLPPLKKGDYYWQELVGLRVENKDGVVFGVVTSMLATGANDVLYIEGEKIHCVPYLPKQVIKHVDKVLGVIVIDWPYEL